MTEIKLTTKTWKKGLYVFINNKSGRGSFGKPYRVIDEAAISDIVQNFERVLRTALQMPVALSPEDAAAFKNDYATREYNGD